MSYNAEILSVAKAGNFFPLSSDSTMMLFLPCAATLYKPALPEMAINPFKFIQTVLQWAQN